MDDGGDPHIHVQVKVIGDAAVRNMVASLFGLAADLPAVVRTGCGLRVPYAMTSPRPESVTCLACREYAREQHLRCAERAEDLSRLPAVGAGGAPVAYAQVAEVHRDLARRFADPDFR